MHFMIYITQCLECRQIYVQIFIAICRRGRGRKSTVFIWTCRHYNALIAVPVPALQTQRCNNYSQQLIYTSDFGPPNFTSFTKPRPPKLSPQKLNTSKNGASADSTRPICKVKDSIDSLFIELSSITYFMKVALARAKIFTIYSRPLEVRNHYLHYYYQLL